MSATTQATSLKRRRVYESNLNSRKVAISESGDYSSKVGKGFSNRLARRRPALEFSHIRDFRPYQVSPQSLRLSQSHKLKVFSQVAASMHFLNRGYSIKGSVNKAADRKTLSRPRTLEIRLGPNGLHDSR